MLYQAKVYFAHWLDVSKLLFPIPVEIHNVFVRDIINSSAYNVLNIANEPEPTRMSNEKVLGVADQFDLVLTWDEEILFKCHNARFFYCGMTWIPEEFWNYNFYEKKQFKVTFVSGTKNLTKNHQMRHRIWHRQNEIIISKDFYNSSHNPMTVMYSGNKMLGQNPSDKIDMLKDSQFHIVIENSNYNNYFSEKLLDAFITRNIPIYVGAPNIPTYFNTFGMLRVEDETEIIEVCNDLKEDYYENHRAYIEENFRLAKDYCGDFTDRIYKEIMDNLS